MGAVEFNHVDLQAGSLGMVRGSFVGGAPAHPDGPGEDGLFGASGGLQRVQP